MSGVRKKGDSEGPNERIIVNERILLYFGSNYKKSEKGHVNPQ
jgi:hypothetical protein